jgi:hypothetical protein
VALTKDVGRGVPFQRTVELTVKPEPLTVMLKAGLPACAFDWLRPLRAEGDGAVMVKVELLDTAPPALTVTMADPCAAIKFAATEAVNLVELTKDVGRDAPFQRTVELAMKPEPVTVREKAGPVA